LKFLIQVSIKRPVDCLISMSEKAAAEEKLDAGQYQSKVYEQLDPFFPKALQDLVVEYATDYKWRCRRCEGVFHFTCEMANAFLDEEAVVYRAEKFVCAQNLPLEEKNYWEPGCEQGSGKAVMTVPIVPICPKGCAIAKKKQKKMKVKVALGFEWKDYSTGSICRVRYIYQEHVVPSYKPEMVLLCEFDHSDYYAELEEDYYAEMEEDEGDAEGDDEDDEEEEEACAEDATTTTTADSRESKN